MHVPVNMGGKAYKYQLDTGADEVIPYGKAEHDGWETKHALCEFPTSALRERGFRQSSRTGTLKFRMLMYKARWAWIFSSEESS